MSVKRGVYSNGSIRDGPEYKNPSDLLATHSVFGKSLESHSVDGSTWNLSPLPTPDRDLFTTTQLAPPRSLLLQLNVESSLELFTWWSMLAAGKQAESDR